jgi:hypothetical protein
MAEIVKWLPESCLWLDLRQTRTCDPLVNPAAGGTLPTEKLPMAEIVKWLPEQDSNLRPAG